MDIYESTTHYLSTKRMFATWQGMESILRRSASTRPRDWMLPIVACQAAGGSPEKAIPAVATLACAQISIILTDDMLDDDPRGEYRRIGHGRAANYAIAFQSAGVDALLESGFNPRLTQEAVRSLNAMMAQTAFGQELDIQNPPDEPAYWRVVENKSTPFYACAFHLGALSANADPGVADALKRLGGIYGEMIQIHDDLNDTMATPANADWLQRRKPLPILFALTVDHPERGRFMELFQNIDAADALQEAQAILIRCGAVSYCVDQLVRRNRLAHAIFGDISLPHREGIIELLDEIIAPIKSLFAVLELPDPAAVMTEAPAYPAE
jgi:geranylgeranyl pyrophosphate synthase